MSNAVRVARHRRLREASGLKRLELTVPAEDAEALRALAERLRRGGRDADEVRDRLAFLRPTRARTGPELLAFFRSSPLVGVDLEIGHDRSAGRHVDLEK